MDEKRMIKISKKLAKHLRHDPGAIGLVLDDAGWVRVEDLLSALSRRGFRVSRAELDEVVTRNDKKRYALSEDGTRIRASQGHSIPVELGLAEAAPPDVLFHGTVHAVLPDILAEGLRPMRRHHVHLSANLETAVRVGARRGRPVVLTVDAARMAVDGHTFMVSDNGVWLTDEVPPAYLAELDS